MRPTDVCHSNELRVPAPRAFPARCRGFHRVDTSQSLGLCAVVPGDRAFHDARDRFGGSTFRTRTSWCSASRQLPGAWAFSSHGADAIEPLTPLSPLPRSLSRSRAFARAPCAVLWGGRTGWREEGAARPASAPPRERRRLRMIGDAFHRQGPFVGSGGHYSPGPATTAPLLAMKRPLNDALTSPWVFRRSSPCFVR